MSGFDQVLGELDVGASEALGIFPQLRESLMQSAVELERPRLRRVTTLSQVVEERGRRFGREAPALPEICEARWQLSIPLQRLGNAVEIRNRCARFREIAANEEARHGGARIAFSREVRESRA